MDPERLKQIEDIFHSAVEVPVPDRHQFLSDICGTDQELRAEVETLLGVSNFKDNLFSTLPEALAAEFFGENEVERSNLIGEMVNQYRIVSLLGKGGMGEVFLAEDTTLDRQVAMKFLTDGFGQHTDKLNRFVREAKAVSALNHPNILTIYEIGEYDGAHFIAAEFIDGQVLNKFKSENKLTLTAILDICIQVVSALQAAHAEGIIHRDIKPDNLMIRKDGIVKVLDFGLAKVRNDKGALAGLNQQKLIYDSGDQPKQENPQDEQAISPKFVTNFGMILGTPNYMSPEQAKGLDVTHQTDIFSFGIVFYELISGKLPFDGKSSKDAIDSILHSDPEKIEDDLVDRTITDIITKCLKKGLVERYQSAEVLLRDLKSAKKNLDFLGSSESLQFQEIEPSARYQSPITVGGDAKVTRAFVLGFARLRKFEMILGLVVLSFLSIAGYLGYESLFHRKQIRSIAVMPFTNDSGNLDMEYLSDGMTENLISSLSNIPNLSVKARSTVFTYKGKEIAIDKVGVELKVDAVLVGHLFQRGEELRLNLELVDTKSLDALWSEIYTRKMTDLVKLQVDIARDVSEKLYLKLSEAEQKQVAKSYTTNSEAVNKYLKGRFHWNKRNVKDFEKAIIYFQEAVKIDPDYAKAYAGLADAFALMPLYGRYKPTEYIPKAKEAALKALELDGDLAEAHVSLGFIYSSFDYDWIAAEREYKKAIDLNPNYPTAHQWYAEHLAFRGKIDKALTEVSKALELDPLSLAINRTKGNILGFAKRYDEAIEHLRKTIDLYPENSNVRYNLGEAYAAKGMHSESIEQYLIGFRLDDRSSAEIEKFKKAYKINGWIGFWEEFLENMLEQRKALLKEDKNSYLSDESLAFAYAATKNKSKTLELLESASQHRDLALITIKASGAYEFLSDDPNFKELTRKMGLPD